MSPDPVVALMHAFVRGIDAHKADWNKTLPEDWESFSLAVGLTDDGEYLTSHGYAYGPDGAWVEPIAARGMMVEDELAAFLADRYPDGQALPVKVLFQLRLTDGSYDVIFEDTDSSRWKPSPANYEQVQRDLRPRFDD